MLLNDVSVEDIVKRLDGVSRHGGYYRAYCPHHGESEGSKPSLLIRESGAYCLSPRCSWHRKVPLTTVESFLDRQGKWLGSSLPFEPFEWPHRSNWTEWCNNAHSVAKSREDVREYLHTRRISVSSLHLAAIGYAAGRLVFPCRSGAEVYSFILRDIGEGSYRVPPKTLNTIYNPFRIESDSYYLTFGIFDAITYSQLGYAAVSTLRNWTNLNVLVEQLKETNKRYVIVPDKGEEQMAEKLRAALPSWQASVFIPRYRMAKDPNGFYTRYGEVKFRRFMTVA